LASRLTLECIGLTPLQEQRLLAYEPLTDRVALDFSEVPSFKAGRGVYLVSSELIPDFITTFHGMRDSLHFLVTGSVHHLAAAFAAGCADFLKEPWEPVELLHRLDHSLDWEAFLPLPQTFHLTETALEWAGKKVPLSFQEYVVFKMLVTNLGHTVSREALFATLWGRPGGSSRTVDMHISSLRKKLRFLTGISGIALLHTVHRKGYKADFTYWLRKCGKAVDNPLKKPEGVHPISSTDRAGPELT
jgi:DNA-binding winged helix-turn-helix (wHTH) protein